MTNYTVWTYAVYLLISIAATIWVAQTLHRHGKTFLVDAFAGNEKLADSVNHLLVVGFYLLNFGYVTLALKYGDKPANLEESFEFVSTKVGLVLLILGGIHLFNVAVFSKFRKHALATSRYDYSASTGTPAHPPSIR
jgi:hypothetical protein